ncbi:glycosyltransferase 8 domain-containing protein 1-like [Corticium candelabrum]|uniref:glycosyltransferase 8 domain-containing protein 1-like n=1 Tax=Corticium candelabrum TaxID=121492 RepID=UPI002E25AB03|nr:glycosyltransferase 8 domain-containing protein 1-like [Corticium candelabrum]
MRSDNGPLPALQDVARIRRTEIRRQLMGKQLRSFNAVVFTTGCLLIFCSWQLLKLPHRYKPATWNSSRMDGLSTVYATKQEQLRCHLGGLSFNNNEATAIAGQALCKCRQGLLFCSRPNIDDVEDKKAIHVLIASPSKRLVGMMALVNSIYSNTNSSLKFHLVTNDQGANHLSIWMSIPKLRNVKREIIVFNRYWIGGRISLPHRGARWEEFIEPITFARFYLPQLLPDFTGRVIYMDDDCIVKGDIRHLHRTFISKNHIGAFSTLCQEVDDHYSITRGSYGDILNYHNAKVQQLGIPDTTCMLNSGLFVVEMMRWKEYNITDQLEYWADLNSRETVFFEAGDQPVFMIVFHGLFSLVNPYWHVRHLGYRAGGRYPKHFFDEEAHLLHWNGANKPWQNPDQYGSNIWRKYELQDPLGIQTTASNVVKYTE